MNLVHGFLVSNTSHIFHDMRREHLDVLMTLSSEARYEEGSYIIRAGDDATRFYLLYVGDVVIEFPGFDRPQSEVQTLTTGDVLGLSWILEPYEYLFSARAVDDVLVLGFDAKATRELMQKDFEFGFELLMRFTRSMAARLEATRVQMVAMAMDIHTSGQSK